MSTKLVRRLLQQTTDFGLAVSKEKEDQHRTAKKNRKRKKPQQERVPVDEEDIVSRQVQSLLFMDKMMATEGSKKDVTAQRMRRSQGKQKHVKDTLSNKILGNSRSSSSGLKKSPVPTFNKKRHQKQQEEKKLASIANLLAKSFKKKKAAKMK